MWQQFLPMFVITFGVLVLVMVGMAIGYILQKKPLKGSCGGVATLMGQKECSFCGNDPNKCDSLSDSDNVLVQQGIGTTSQKALMGKTCDG